MAEKPYWQMTYAERAERNREHTDEVYCDICGKPTGAHIYESDIEGSYFYCSACVRENKDDYDV